MGRVQPSPLGTRRKRAETSLLDHPLNFEGIKQCRELNEACQRPAPPPRWGRRIQKRLRKLKNSCRSREPVVGDIRHHTHSQPTHGAHGWHMRGGNYRSQSPHRHAPTAANAGRCLASAGASPKMARSDSHAGKIQRRQEGRGFAAISQK